MGISASKITSKGQTTIPAEVRAKLRLKPGDALVCRQPKAGVVIRQAGVLDAEFLKLREHTLSDWLSTEADEAFRKL